MGISKKKKSLKTNNERNKCFGALPRAQSLLASICTLLLVCGGLIVHAARFGSRIEASANSATRLCIHSWNVCLTHSVWFRCHSLVVVRCLTCRSIENVGVFFSCNVVLSFSSLQCSCPRRDSLHLHFLDAITLRRRPTAEIDAETEEVSNSGPVQQFCLFDHTWKFGPSSAITHNEVAPERELPPTAVAEVKWKLFSLIEEGLTRCWESNVSATRMFVLYVPSFLVFRCCNGPDQESFLIDQEHHVKRPEFIACGGGLPWEFFPRKGRISDWITSARWQKK